MISKVSQALETPWKIRTELIRWLTYPRARLLFAVNGIAWNEGWRLYGLPIIQKHRQSHLSFGPNLQLRSYLRANPLGVNHAVILATWQPDAWLEVGANFCMSGGTICAASRIIIGDHVVVGANTTIVDTDFHPLHYRLRLTDAQSGKSEAVFIQDHVFIGMNCLILKGVTIGWGSVIGAGSVVVQDVPPNTVVFGNPARPIRQLKPASRHGQHLPRERATLPG